MKDQVLVREPDTAPLLPDLLALTARALDPAQALLAAAKRRIAAEIAPRGTIDASRLEARQFAVHGYAWMATYVEALRQMHRWAEHLSTAGKLRELEALMLQMAFGEYLAQLAGGIALSQAEILRPADLALEEDDLARFRTADVATLTRLGNTEAVRARVAELLSDALAGGDFGDIALGDEALDMVRDQFRRFGAERVQPFAHDWHLKDVLIPLPVVEEMAGLGVFGLTVPERFGGLGLGKTAMCIVSEELSRAYIGVGSLGTRSEIAAELIRLGGTPQQQAHYLPKIAAGEILPTAVFTEPNTGSDLGSLKTRAVRDGAHYKIFGAKTWITHAARSDLMTLLGAHRLRHQRLSRPQHVPRREAARQRRQSFPRGGHERQRDPRLGLSRHEGIRDRLRRLRRAGGESAGRRRGPGLQAAHGDLRERPHPDRVARRRRRAERARAGPALRAKSAANSASPSTSSRGSSASSPGWRSRP